MNLNTITKGVHTIPKKQLKEINGGLGPVFWLMLGAVVGAVVGSIEDVNSGIEKAKESY